MLPDAEITLEPPAECFRDPMIRLAAGPVEACAPIDRGRLEALKADIERALKG